VKAAELKKFSGKPNKQGSYKTQQDHCNNWKIKPEIFFFNPDIPRQAANPVQLFMKEINDNTYQYNDDPCCDNPFTRFAIHIAKLQ